MRSRGFCASVLNSQYFVVEQHFTFSNHHQIIIIIMKFTAAFAALFSSFGLLVAANPITLEDPYVAFSLSFGEEGGSDRKLGVFEDEKNRQLADVTLAVDFGVGQADGSALCGGNDYQCTFLDDWNEGIRTFTDPTTPAFLLCGLKVTLYGTALNSQNVQVDVLLNDISIGTSSALGGDFLPDACETAEVPTLFYSDLLDIYNKGGENTIQLVASWEICVDRVELDFADECPPTPEEAALQDCIAANPCTPVDGACAQEIEVLYQSNIALYGDSCPSEAPSGAPSTLSPSAAPSSSPSAAPSSSPSGAFCNDACMDDDGNEGIAFCTIGFGKDDDKRLHNRCDTTPDVQLGPGDLDNIDGREIYSCGCCDLTVPDTSTDFTEVKRSKKGAHCEAEYEIPVRKLSAAGMKKNQSKNSIRRMAPL